MHVTLEAMSRDFNCQSLKIVYEKAHELLVTVSQAMDVWAPKNDTAGTIDNVEKVTVSFFFGGVQCRLSLDSEWELFDREWQALVLQQATGRPIK